MKAILLAILLSVTHPTAPIEPCTVWQAVQRYDFIEEHHLKRVYLSCYLATGNNCADGTLPREGVVSSNKEHLGMDCIVYDNDLTAVMRLECRDIGGHKMLREGTAIDVYRDSLARAYELRDEYGLYVWVEWIPREEGTDEDIH
jgi:hypothetical protein